MIEKIKTLAAKYYPEVLEIRRHLHQYPELSFAEKKTSQYISKKLEEKGIEHEMNWGGFGIVVNMVNDKESETIALRADIDALPITEENNVSYKSKNEGVMHACGHDVHTANLLGTIFILNELRGQIAKNFRFIFQPAEEKLPGGASILIKEGVLENPKPKCILGLHVYPQMECGLVGFRKGMYMASADEIYITAKGKGGHAAMPNENVDTVLLAASIIMNLQQVVSRNSHPNIPSVLSIGKINSEGGATNIIPDQVKMEGTFRTMNEEWRKEAHELVHRICSKTAELMGGSCEVEIRKGYPFLVNDPSVTANAENSAKTYLGRTKVHDLPIRMTSEDFSFYSQEIPACFYRLGTANQSKGIVSSVHTSTFNIDEDALRFSSGLMAYLAINQ